MNLSTPRRLLLAALLPIACQSGDAGTDSSTSSTSSVTSTSNVTSETATSETSGTDSNSTGTSPTSTDATGTTQSTTTSTTGTTGDPVACDPGDLPPEGSPCSDEGQFCNSGCEDPCQFCNILQCSRGTWQPAEVFPAQCPSCDDLCPAVLDAQCLGGPPDLAGCLTGCNQSEVGACMIVYHQALACGGPAPIFECNVDGRPVVAGCEAQWDAFYACFLP